MALGLSGCTYRPIDDPKYGRLDSRNIFERAMLEGWGSEKPAPMVRAEIEKLLEANQALADDERTLTALGATCRRENRSLRCIYRRQVRYRATLMPPTVDQYEFEVDVAPDRDRIRKVAVCYGSSAMQTGEPSDYWQPENWRCSPSSAVSTPCKDRPRKYGIMDGRIWDCRP